MYAEKPALISFYLGQQTIITKRTKKIKLVEWTDTLREKKKHSNVPKKKYYEIIENIYDPTKKTINGTFCYSNINKYESYDEKALTVYTNVNVNLYSHSRNWYLLINKHWLYFVILIVIPIFVFFILLQTVFHYSFFLSPFRWYKNTITDSLRTDMSSILEIHFYFPKEKKIIWNTLP